MMPTPLMMPTTLMLPTTLMMPTTLMTLTEVWDWSLDGWIVLAGVLCAVAAALPGNFLVLRRMSMLGDAISHAILPGLAAAFFLSSSRSSLAMFVGAVVVGVLTAVFTEWIRGFGEVDEGASMGVVFTTLFALGLVMIVQAADHVDLDPGCVLYGAIELTPLDTVSVAGMEIPRVVLVLGTVLLINLAFVGVFFKELKLTSFDPALATSCGIPAGLMHYLLMVLVAITAVASFESVGNILVVAMFVVPAATARLLTDRLSRMVVLSTAIAAAGAVLGHVAAITVPRWFGFPGASTAGMMALMAGLLFLLAALFSPGQGVIVRSVRHQLLSLRILAEDLIALMYRIEERGTGIPGDTGKPGDTGTPGMSSATVKAPETEARGTEARGPIRHPTTADLRGILLSGPWLTPLLMAVHCHRRLVTRRGRAFLLTEAGRRLGSELVRSHRLWEQYLVSEAGVPRDRIHDQAERLEHFTGRGLRGRLDQETSAPRTDPHGSRIPSEGEIPDPDLRT